MADVDLDVRTFQKTLADLKAQHSGAHENPQSFQVKDCRSCTACMFCTSCTGCYRCTYCTRSELCSECTHCTACESCHASSYCVQSARCVGSKYLEHCESCADCTYCFGCVGLSKKDFHILNQPYDKKTYFIVVAKLKKALG